jgi:redox-sensitive bicupin YhaK (pirin superfamily)
MIERRPKDGLGRFDFGWLDTRHHFSFGDYHDPGRMGWGSLRVWNDDEIAPQTGFPPHPHRDMEIITYVRKGAITHQDSLGNSGRTEAGDVQVMSAGSGIRHAEYNLEAGGEPFWNQRPFPKADRSGRFAILASGEDDPDALPIRADARVLGATLKAGDSAAYELGVGRHAYLASTHGDLEVNGVRIDARDGAAISDESRIEVKALADAEVVLVDTL